MKTFKSRILMVLTACAVALATLPQSVHAITGAPESLGITNVIPVGYTLIGSPTNRVSVSTNTAGWLTGRAIDVKNYDTVNIRVMGAGTFGGSTNISDGATNYPTVTTNFLEIGLVRAGDDGRALDVNTNSYWESISSFIVRCPINGSTTVNWSTNLPSWWVGNAAYIGANRVTNTCVNVGSFAFSNLVVTIEKKLKPIVYP